MGELSREERTERDLLLLALQRHGYELTATATELGMHRSTLARRARRYGLDPLLEERNPRLRHLRVRQVVPRSPAEPTRQADHRARNRTLGLCGCGEPPVPLQNGKPGKSCAACRAGDRDRKRAAT